MLIIYCCNEVEFVHEYVYKLNGYHDKKTGCMKNQIKCKLIINN